VSIQHSDIGAYSLGLLEPRDRREFEDHLAGCSSCAAELAALSPMAELLRDIEPVEAPGAEAAQPGGAEVTQLIRRRADRQRHRTRRQVVLGAAAAVVLLAGGIAVGVATAPGQNGTGAAQLTVVGQRHSATDPATGVAGTVGLLSKPWGTQVTLDLSKVRGPLECELVAVSRTGERRVVVGWLVPAAGYGVPGHPGHLILEGGTSIPRGDLAGVEVDVVRGRTLVSIPA
jgi:Putative zinc-finger